MTEEHQSPQDSGSTLVLSITDARAKVGTHTHTHTHTAEGLLPLPSTGVAQLLPGIRRYARSESSLCLNQSPQLQSGLKEDPTTLGVFFVRTGHNLHTTSILFEISKFS